MRAAVATAAVPYIGPCFASNLKFGGVGVLELLSPVPLFRGAKLPLSFTCATVCLNPPVDSYPFLLIDVIVN